MSRNLKVYIPILLVLLYLVSNWSPFPRPQLLNNESTSVQTCPNDTQGQETAKSLAKIPQIDQVKLSEGEKEKLIQYFSLLFVIILYKLFFQNNSIISL